MELLSIVIESAAIVLLLWIIYLIWNGIGKDTKKTEATKDTLPEDTEKED